MELPPGVRFYPTEEELITFYLYYKLIGQKPELDRVIPSIDIYQFEPSQLPGLAGEPSHGDTEQWFFFMPQQEREARGGRPNRTTDSGYWKATGSPSCVYSSQNKVIGVKKTMVFYKGKAPTGRKTKWKMNEYKAIKEEDNITYNTNASSSSTTIPKLRHELSLCRVYVTSGCARAFDRRPPGTISNIEIRQNVTSNFNQADQGSGRAASQIVNAAALLTENSASTDSSNSGGDEHRTLQEATAGSSNSYDCDMSEDLGTLFDLGELGWL